MEMTIHITAPELVGAINTLAAALEAGNFKLTTSALCADIVDPTNADLAPVNPTPAPVQPMVQPTTVSVAQAVPTAAPSYTMEQLAVAATQLVDAGQRDNLVALLGQFGVQALNVLPKEQYGNFANALRGMGAKL